MPWIDILPVAGATALVIGAAVLCVCAGLQNWRDARRAADTHAEQYERFLRFLSMVRDAHRQG
jgi:hypothetical protein